MAKTTKAAKTELDVSNFITIIVSRGGETAILKADGGKKQYHIAIAPPKHTADGESSTRINCLAALIDVLKGVKEKASTLNGVMNIYTVGLVKKAIDEGYYKHWLTTGKTQKNELSDTEIALWNEFVDLYFDRDLMLHINIKDVPSMRQQNNNSKRSARDRDPQYDFLLLLSEKAWSSVKPVEPTVIADELPF